MTRTPCSLNKSRKPSEAAPKAYQIRGRVGRAYSLWLRRASDHRPLSTVIAEARKA